MKNLELEGFGLVELNSEEMLLVDGGSWIGDAIRWVVDHHEVIITLVVCALVANARTVKEGLTTQSRNM